jgi:hypothetical protein
VNKKIDVKHDLFIDISFVSCLMSEKEWLEVLRRQAKVFREIGDLGESTWTYRYFYRGKAKSYVVERFREIYDEKMFEEKITNVEDEKIRRAWRTLLMFFVIQNFVREVKTWGDPLPFGAIEPEDVKPILDELVEERVKRREKRADKIIREVFERNGFERSMRVAPFLWWINIMMESDVFDRLISCHKSLTSCQSLKRLQSAMLLVRLWRRDVEKKWEDFLNRDIMTYLLATYVSEIQRLAETEKTVSVLDFMLPRKWMDGWVAQRLSKIIFISPMLTQYFLDVHRRIFVSPADIVIALARIAKSRGKESFIVGVHDLTDEIIKFWSERDILRRLKHYLERDITRETLIEEGSLVDSIAINIEAGMGRFMRIALDKLPDFRLPPRMLGFDSLYVWSAGLQHVIEIFFDIERRS